MTEKYGYEPQSVRVRSNDDTFRIVHLDDNNIFVNTELIFAMKKGVVPFALSLVMAIPDHVVSRSQFEDEGVTNMNQVGRGMGVVNSKLIASIGFEPIQIVRGLSGRTAGMLIGCRFHTAPYSTEETERIVPVERVQTDNPESRIRLTELQEELIKRLRLSPGVAHNLNALQIAVSRDKHVYTREEVDSALRVIFSYKNARNGVFADLAVRKSQEDGWVFGSVPSQPAQTQPSTAEDTTAINTDEK